MKNLIIGMMLLLIALTAQAQQSKNAKFAIEVNGNCDQCQHRIQQAAFSVNGVKSANWNIDTHILDLIINEKKTTIEVVEKAIAKVGHDIKDLKATKESYDKLPECCKYERNK